MKKVILMGSSACGKTTLCQRLTGQKLEYKKTQAIEIICTAIDTPGEYLENRGMLKALIVTAVEADVVLFVQDATDERFFFSPGQASMFANPVVGIVTKADLATPWDLSRAAGFLELAGASQQFVVSAVSGEGIPLLKQFLDQPSAASGKGRGSL